MPEQETVVSETTETQPETPEITAESSVEEIMASRGEADDSEAVTASETEQSEPQGEGETPPSEEVGTSENSDDEVKVGDPVPYKRFDEVNTEKNTIKTELETAQADLEEARQILQDPDVLQVALKKKGYTDEAITEYMQKQGIERQVDGTGEIDFDTTSAEAWLEAIDKRIDALVDKKLSPVKQTLTQKEQEAKEQEAQVILDKQWDEASKLGKDKWQLERGVEKKDADNNDTVVGRVTAYLRNHPEDAGLGPAKVLRLAMSDEPSKKAEERGVIKEKKRVEKVKAGAMESESSVTSEEYPQADWSPERIIAWRRKNNKE